MPDPSRSPDAAWEPPAVTDADLRESKEKLRAGALRMIERGRRNPADYGPINIWPHTVLALIGDDDGDE